jgi:hypothetical protein
MTLSSNREEHCVVDLKHLFSARAKLFKADLLLVLLAISDSFFTDFGIRNNHITEANPLMRFIYETSVFGFYSIKIGLPFLLLYILTKIEPKKYLQLLMGTTLFLYSCVLCLHILWISLIAVI